MRSWPYEHRLGTFSLPPSLLRGCGPPASCEALCSSAHLPLAPQNREVFMAAAGDGSLYLYKYHYPDQRKVKVSARCP